MKITRTIVKEEELNVNREMWEISYDVGWEAPEWRVLARRDTLEEAYKAALEKGYNLKESDIDLNDYNKTENRDLQYSVDASYVYDYYTRKRIDLIHITHYYIFED